MGVEGYHWDLYIKKRDYGVWNKVLVTPTGRWKEATQGGYTTMSVEVTYEQYVDPVTKLVPGRKKAEGLFHFLKYLFYRCIGIDILKTEVEVEAEPGRMETVTEFISEGQIYMDKVIRYENKEEIFCCQSLRESESI